MPFIAGSLDIIKKVGRKLKVGRAMDLKQERSTPHVWSVVRQSLLNSIWNHRRLDCAKCPDTVPIDINCGSLNPYLCLHLYPYGLFSDKGKSMTLVIKVVIPDDCPPIPSDASFSMTWELFSIDEVRAAKKFQWSSRPKELKFTTGMDYIHKFLQHDALQQQCCKKLEIHVHLKTGYSVYHTHDDRIINEITKHSTKTGIYSKCFLYIF